VTLPAEIALHVTGERLRRIGGSLLFTHFGLSGPAALDASRHFLRARLEARDPRVTLAFLPGRDAGDVDAELVALARARPRLSLDGALALRLPQAVGRALLDEGGFDPTLPLGRLTKGERRRLARALAEWPLDVRDSRGFVHAEATAGGVPLDEVEAGTLESRRCPGLHFAGEILDVDGRLGGFNFQWAWASGCVAGRAVARALGA
jgi:predicted Rossmann fold flavoprotein